MPFLIEQIQIFYGNWSPKGAQRDPKIEELGGQFGHPPLDPPGEPNGPKMEPKCSQNGAKMELKWSENGANMEPIWS